ncbi:MAG: epoxyqueuosine reductase [Candidatus Bathyarchaeia archaeon]
MKVNSEVEKLVTEVKEVALKAGARSLGADLVGVVSAADIDTYPRQWVGWYIQDYTKKTTEIMPDAKSIVVIGSHVWDYILETALKKKDEWVYPGYFPLFTQTRKVAFFLRAKGYKAVSFPHLSLKKLAQLAGFGAFGKNALIINPKFGPWIRLGAVLTNAEMAFDKPFEQDLCGDCDDCIKACPVGALTPYKVNDAKCLVGIHLTGTEISKYTEVLRRYEPSLTKKSHLMCIECQKVCKYGKKERML